MIRRFRKDRTVRRRDFAPSVEGTRLEGRLVLSAASSVELDPLTRTLSITGTADADTVLIAEFDDSFLLQVNGDFHVLSPGDFDAVCLKLGGGDDQFEYFVETQTAGVSRTVEVDLGRGDDFGAVYAFGPLVDSSFSFDVDGGLGADILRVGLTGATLERSSLDVNLAGGVGDDLVLASADGATVRDGRLDVAVDAGPGNDLITVLGEGGNRAVGTSTVRYDIKLGPGADVLDIRPGYEFAGPDGRPIDVLTVRRGPRWW